MASKFYEQNEIQTKFQAVMYYGNKVPASLESILLQELFINYKKLYCVSKIIEFYNLQVETGTEERVQNL